MRTRFVAGAVVIVGILVALLASPRTVLTQSSAALTGKVTSQADGAVEGVLVTATREGSTVMTTVASNDKGQYSFPRNRMEPGKYSIAIRAAGYVLPNPALSVE